MTPFNTIPYPDPRFPNLWMPAKDQIWITKNLINRELDGNTPLWDWDGGNVVTINDTLSIPIKEKEVGEFLEKLQSRFWIYLRSKEWLEKVSKVYSIALDYFNGYLERNVPKVFLSKKLNTFDEITSFIQWTYTFWWENTYRQTYCSLSKIMFSILEIEKMWIPLDWWDLVDSFNSFIQKRYSNANLRASWWISFWSFSKKLKDWKEYSVHFQLENRAKNLHSIISKLLAKPELSPQDAVNDFLWIRSVTWSFIDTLFLLEWEFIHIYNRKPREFRQKHFISEDQVNEFLSAYWEDLDSDFKKLFTPDQQKGKVTLQWKSRLKNNPDFQDIKLLWKITLNRKAYNFESQHFLSDNKNGVGFSNHKILELYRKIEVIERLEWYVTSNYILRIIESFLKAKYGEKSFQNIDILSEQIRIFFSPRNNNKIFSWFPSQREEIKVTHIWFNIDAINYEELNSLFQEVKWIYNYLSSKLVKVNIKDQRSWVWFYKVGNRLENQRKEWILPEGLEGKW